MCLKDKLKDYIDSCRRKTLEAFLKVAGLPTSGLKNALVLRLHNYVDLGPSTEFVTFVKSKMQTAMSRRGLHPADYDSLNSNGIQMDNVDSSISASGNVSMQDFERRQQGINPMRVPSTLPPPQMAHQHSVVYPTSWPVFERPCGYSQDPPHPINSSVTNFMRKPIDLTDAHGAPLTSSHGGYAPGISGSHMPTGMDGTRMHPNSENMSAQNFIRIHNTSPNQTTRAHSTMFPPRMAHQHSTVVPQMGFNRSFGYTHDPQSTTSSSDTNNFTRIPIDLTDIRRSITSSSPPSSYLGGYVPVMSSERLYRVPACPPQLAFVDSPFYKTINVIVPPTIMTPSDFCFTPGKRSYERLIDFRINSDQAETITYHSRRIDECKREFGVQVIMRFGRLDPPQIESLVSTDQQRNQTSSHGLTPFNDTMPFHLLVHVNGRPPQLPPLLPTTRPNMDGRRNARPVHITPLLRISPSTSNHVKFMWTHDYAASTHHFFAIYLVRKHSTAELCEALRLHAFQEAPVSRKQIIDKLASSSLGASNGRKNSDTATAIPPADETNTDVDYDDDDLQIQNTLPVQLLCPLSKCRISLPVRGRRCQHIQCYDANTYLLINERKPAWKCPVCDTPTPFRELLVDGIMLDVLGSNEAQDVEEIVFNEDGSWSSMRRTATTSGGPNSGDLRNRSTSSTGSSPATSSTTAPDKRNAASSSVASACSTGNNNEPAAAETIDLTESDDETEPRAKRPTLPHPSASQQHYYYHPSSSAYQKSLSDNNASPGFTTTTTSPFSSAQSSNRI